jgi:hypothetical protein
VSVKRKCQSVRLYNVQRIINAITMNRPCHVKGGMETRP